MPLKHYTLIYLLSFSFTLAAQSFEVKYFNKDWELSNSSDYKYYREAVLVDSIIKIKDYYKNKGLQWEGSIVNDTSFLKKGYLMSCVVGKSIFYQKDGSIKNIEIHQPRKHINEIMKYYPEMEMIKDSLIEDLYFEVYYHNNGNIKSKGFGYENDYDSLYYNWFFYDKKERLQQIKRFGTSPSSHLSVWFNAEGEIIQRTQFKNYVKDGFHKRYYDSIIYEDGFYKEGKKHGKFTFYRLNTYEIKSVKVYEDGKRIK